MTHENVTAAIEVSGLTKRFGDTVAVDGIDLTVPPGSVLGLLGPNGAGKTTVVRILATLLRADTGTVRVGGFDVARQAHQVRQSIGLTGQYASVDADLTGLQNLVMIGRLLGLPRAEAKRRAAESIDEAGLREAATRAAKTYSGGMRRRLDLAASLVSRPAVVFLDEPTTGLDPARRGETWEMVRTLSTQGSTVLLTTQYLEEADHLADEIVVLDAGRIAARGTPDELKRRLGRRLSTSVWSTRPTSITPPPTSHASCRPSRSSTTQPAGSAPLSPTAAPCLRSSAVSTTPASRSANSHCASRASTTSS